jgi:hypothetical protein
MKERVPSFSKEENAHQKTVESIIELLKGKSIEECDEILWHVKDNIKKTTKV